MITKIFLLLTIIVSIKSEYVNYKYHKVYTVTPTTEKEVQALLDLKNSNDFVFWIEGIKVGLENRIDVAAEKQRLFEKYVSDAGIKAELIIEDVQSLIDNQVKRSKTRNSNEYAWDYYQNLDEIYEWMNRTAEAYSSVASIINIGATAEGRPILGMVIDFKKRERPYYSVIEGGLHAREWITPATCTWIIKEFLTSNDRGVRAMAEDVVWYIFPVTNPDGYVYSFTDNRMWRKNRNPAMQTSCAHMNRPDDMSVGVDLNRNFDFLWMTVGASGNPCDITYAGPSAFSEAESLAMANLINGLQERGSLLYYLSFHSYTQLLLIPYSHVRGSDVLEADNYADLFEIGIKGMDKLTARHNTTYRVGTSADILYEVSGSGFDWAKGGAHFPLVFLFELRDTGRFGFLLPPEEIIPTSEETMDGMVEMDRVARSMGYYRGSAHSFTASGFMILLLAAMLVAK